MTTQPAHQALEPGRVDLWFCATGAAGVEVPNAQQRRIALAHFEQLLDEEELAHSQRLRLPQHQREYVLSHALLRATLSQYAAVPPTQWRFLRNEFGKPSLIETPGVERLRFNLSHTQGLSVCAVTLDADLGVDVEYHANRASLLEVADQYFSEREVADLAALPLGQQGDAFFRYWTLKESYIKARGAGLSIPLDSFSFRFEADEKVQFIDHLDDGAAPRWQFRSLRPSLRHSAAVAVRAPQMQWRLFWSTVDSAEPVADETELAARMLALEGV